MTWIPLLLADPSPCLRLLVLRDLLNRPESDAEIQELKTLQPTDSRVKLILALQDEDGSFRSGEGGGAVPPYLVRRGPGDDRRDPGGDGRSRAQGAPKDRVGG